MPLLAAAAPVAAPVRRAAPAPRASAGRPAAPSQPQQPGARQPAARLAALPGGERSGDGAMSGGAHEPQDAAQRPATAAASASWGDAPAASTEAPLLSDGEAEASQERDAPSPDAVSAPPSDGNALRRALKDITAQEYVVIAIYGMLAALTVARCVAPPVALPMRLMGTVLAALLCRFAGDAAMWARGVPQSLSDADATALRPWLALRAAAELGGGALAAATRNGCAGATLLVAGHLVFNAATSGRMDEYGYVRKLDTGERQRLTGISAAVTALGVAACATSDAAPGSPRATAALATSIAFTVAVGCWLLYSAGKLLLLWMLARTYAGQRC